MAPRSGCTPSSLSVAMIARRPLALRFNSAFGHRSSSPAEDPMGTRMSVSSRGLDDEYFVSVQGSFVHLSFRGFNFLRVGPASMNSSAWRERFPTLCAAAYGA
jgi:hypothetical protein